MNIVTLTVITLAVVTLLQWSPDIGVAMRRKLNCLRGALTEGNRLNDILKYEAENNFSRAVVTVLSGQNLSVGAVIGKATKGACPTTGTAGTNTGNGTCASVTASAAAKVGVYTLKCILAATNGGIFSVEDPDGYALPNARVAVAYTNDQINFTISDGANDFAAGDSFTITIPAGTGKVKELDLDALDGTADAYGIMIADCDASAADKAGVAIIRDARIITANLVWPTGATSDQKAAALVQLLIKRIEPITEA